MPSLSCSRAVIAASNSAAATAADCGLANELREWVAAAACRNCGRLQKRTKHLPRLRRKKCGRVRPSLVTNQTLPRCDGLDLILLEGTEINTFNKVGETIFAIAETQDHEELIPSTKGRSDWISHYL